MSPALPDVRSRRRWLVPRLLAGRPDPTRAEKDRIFDAIMRDVDAAAAPRRRLAPLLALLGAAAVLVLVPIAVLRMHSSSELAARGPGASATFSVFCAGAPVAACRTGDTLLFDVTPGDWRHFAAFARREDGAIIWYAPAGTGGDLASAGVLATGIVLDAEHRPGRYQVYGVFSLAPLDRAAIRARFAPDGTPIDTDDAEIVVRELDIR